MIVAAIDWRSVFVPTESLLELFLRGSIMYSVTEAVVLVGTIFVWNYALDWLSYRSRGVCWWT